MGAALSHDNEGDKPVRHVHEAKCWKSYEPCVEHHAHSYSCGGGELAPACPEYKLAQARQAMHELDEAISVITGIKERTASAFVKLGAKEALERLARARLAVKDDYVASAR